MSNVIAALLDGVARHAIWLPAALTGYFALRAVGLPVMLGPVLLLAYLFYRFGGSRRPIRRVGPPIVITVGREDVVNLALFAGLILIVCAPGVRLFAALGTGHEAQGFLFSDEAYNLMIAQGLGVDFPPPDLSWQGSTLKYHLGGPLLLEMLHRYSTVELHTIFYGALPIGLKAIAAASVFRIAGLIFPHWSTRQLLLCTLASGGIFIVDFYNVAWNVRNIAKTGVFAFDTIAYGMPVAIHPPGFLDPRVYYGSSLAVVLFLTLLANLRQPALLLGCTLFSIFLAKASVFVAIGVAWGCYALHGAIRLRDFRALAAGGLALLMCICATPYLVIPGMATLGQGPGQGTEVLLKRGAHLASALHVERTAGVAALGAISLLAGLQLFGLSIGWLALHSRGHASRGDGRPQLLMALSLVAAALVACLVVAHADPRLQAHFNEIHGGIRDALWLDFDTYLDEMLKQSIGAATIVVTCTLGIFGALGAFSWLERTSAPALRWILGGMTVIAIAIPFGGAADAVLRPVPAGAKIVSTDAARALATIPRGGAVVFTNDCGYDRDVERHLPLMNAWAPALYGHQFWASNFMFWTFAEVDAVSRLRRFQRFWNTGIGDEHHAFLRQNGINYLFVRRDMLQNPVSEAELDNAGWARLLYRGSEYSVYRIVDAVPRT